MSGLNTAGLVAELREWADAEDNGGCVEFQMRTSPCRRAADALTAQAAELVEVRRLLERARTSRREWSDDAIQQDDRATEATRSRDEALAALKAAEEATDERIDTAWADGARFVMNELDSLIPDSPLVRSKLVDIDLRIAQRYADAIASRKNRRARSVLENSKSRLADANSNPGTEQREAGRNPAYDGPMGIFEGYGEEP